MSKTCSNRCPQDIRFDGTKIIYWKCNDCGATWSRADGGMVGWSWNGGVIIEHVVPLGGLEAGGILSENDPAYLMFDRMIQSGIEPYKIRGLCLYICKVMNRDPKWIYDFYVKYRYGSIAAMDIVLGSDKDNTDWSF